MSKVILTLFFSLVIIIFASIPTRVYGLEKCLIGTNPSELTDKTDKAKFTISVANLGGSGAFDKWKIQFKCGAPNFTPDATKDGSDKIYAEAGNGPLICIFSPGVHEILVKGVVSGTEVDQCTAQYFVKDASTLCRLSINPDTGITSKTSLTVSGTNLSVGGKFAVFFDNQNISSFPSFVNTPTFSGVQVPTNLLTPGSHKVGLRSFDITPLSAKFGLPLCSLGLTVGTSTKPGSVSAPGPAGIINWIPGIAAKATPCDTNPDNPGIRTAIGCIHTNPVSLIKDVLGFVIGIAGGLAFLMMILGAFQMLTSAGNPETLNVGKERLTNAIIGLLFVIFSVLLLQIIGFDILRIPDFAR